MLEKCGVGGDEPLVAAVSGGADSIFLLHALSALGRKVLVVHVNHGLRGEESSRDAAFVEEMCEGMGIDCVVRRINVGTVSKKGEGVEGAARRLRYRELADVARERGVRWIATGHTADDQAETVLMRVKRGCDIRGVRGILPVRCIGGDLRVVRPLLDVRRRELEVFLREHGLRWVVDSSNFDAAYERNRVRRRLGVLDGSLHDRLVDVCKRMASCALRDWKRVEDEVDRIIGGCFVGGDGSLHVFEVGALVSAGALVSYVMAVLLQRVGGAVSRETVGKLCEMLDAGRGALDVPPRLRVSVEHGFLCMARGDRAVEMEEPLCVPGRAILPDGSVVSATEMPPVEPPREDPFREVFVDLGRCLFVRYRREGDRIRTADGVVRKLQDVFVDLKVPLSLRDRVPLVCDADGRVLWVCGLRRAFEGFVGGDEERCTLLEFRPSPFLRRWLAAWRDRGGGRP